MKIGIDISQIIYEGTGVARFTRGLVQAIINNDTENNWVFLFSSLRGKLDDQIKRDINKKGFKLINCKLPPSLLSFIWNDLHILSPDFALGKLDWLITSDWTEPPSKIKKATIVHDLVYKRYPETVSNMIRTTQEKRIKWIKKETRLIFADSEATRKDLIELEGVAGEKIKVIYPGVEVVKPNKQQVEKTLKKYHLKKSFILTVGKIEPRKNIKRLLEAYHTINNKNVELVIVGPQGWDDESVNNLNNNVHYLGYISDTELYSLMSVCLVFVYPSIWEGFGYPAIEAMSLGAPICTSNSSSLVEIVNNNAVLFDPFKTQEIATSLNKLVNDFDLRKKLITNGKLISKEFNWKNYYNQLIKSLSL